MQEVMLLFVGGALMLSGIGVGYRLSNGERPIPQFTKRSILGPKRDSVVIRPKKPEDLSEGQKMIRESEKGLR